MLSEGRDKRRSGRLPASQNGVPTISYSLGAAEVISARWRHTDTYRTERSMAQQRVTKDDAFKLRQRSGTHCRPT